MSEIDNNNRADNDEQRRLQQLRDNNRKEAERKNAREPAKAFEAKLSEKARLEREQKENHIKQKQPGDRKKKSQQEEESLVAKLLGAAKEQGAEEAKSRVDGLRERGHHDEFEQHAKDEFGKQDAEAHETHDSKSAVKTESGKKSEAAGDGHKRIEEQPQQQGGGEGGSGQQGQSQNSDGGQQQGFGSSGRRDDSGGRDIRQSGKGAATKSGAVFAVKQAGTGSQGRFQQNAPAFTRKDLDDIVASVQLSVDGTGNDQLSVQLDNAYYDGLKIQAERTDQGVILRFICPNTSVRSTFVKFRPQVYEHLKAKGVAVFRIDVV